MKQILTFFQMSFKNQSAYRGAMYVYFVSTLFHLGVTLLIWLSAQNQVYAGYTKPEILGYYLVLMFIDTLIGWYVFNPIAQEIRNGEVLTHLLKPVSYMKVWFGLEAGFKAVGSIIYLIGTVIISMLFLTMRIPVSVPAQTFGHLVIIALSFVNAIMLSFTLTFLLGLLAFWLTETQFIDFAYFTIIPFLSGDIVPTSFLPQAVQQINVFLPFRYQMSFPLEIIFHKLDASQIVTGFLVSVVWFSIYMLMYRVLWKYGTRAYMAFGQ